MLDGVSVMVFDMWFKIWIRNWMLRFLSLLTRLGFVGCKLRDLNSALKIKDYVVLDKVFSLS